MSQLADDLRAARALIDSPEKWARHDGHIQTKAWFGLITRHSYCIIGAVCFARKDQHRRDRMVAALSAIEPNLVRFNATATAHADIMALFDRAITDAETSHAE